MRRSTQVGLIATLAAALLVTSLGTVSAQTPTQVQGLTAEQHQGFTTLSWQLVDGATDYQVERTPVNDADEPVGGSTIVGLWQPIRTITPEQPRFADAGFELGDRYQWRVRARLGASNPQEWSAPVYGTTLPEFGSGAPWFGIAPGADLRTVWELSPTKAYTTHQQELDYTHAVDELSDRVRVVEIGRSNPVSSAPEGREINMFIIGGRPDPANPAEVIPYETPQQIAETPAVLFYCNVHGNEPQGRESCLILARMLAFTTDPALLDMLASTTVLIIPSSNPNGRAANTRGNETGQDLNRDHLNIEQPETKALAQVLRDYAPKVGIDLHQGDSEDLPVLSSRHLNVYEGLFTEAKSGLVEGWIYDNAALSGWWAGPYNNGGDSHEGILRNTFGLKNMVGMLAENRASAGNTRPNSTTAANRKRQSYGSLWQEIEVLEYYWTRRDEIHTQVEAAKEFNASNSGRVVLRGSYPWPAFPGFPPHGLPSVDAPTAARIIDPAPCGYFVTEEQYSGDRFGGPLALRLDLHGVEVDNRPAGHVVRLAQALRGLIPMMLDPAAVSPSPIVNGQRLFECPHADVAEDSLAAATPEDTETTLVLTILNEVLEPDQDLTWTITEAEDDCASPTDLSWVSTSPESGTTGATSSSRVDVTFSADGIAAKDTQTGLLCLNTNDAGAPVIAVPLTLEVHYPFGGLQSPAQVPPPGLNVRKAGSNVPVKFSLNGDRGTEILADGALHSQQVGCGTLEPLSGSTPARTPGSSGLSYQASTDTYQYNWKSEASWRGTCRVLTIALDDGSEHVAYFRFE